MNVATAAEKTRFNINRFNTVTLTVPVAVCDEYGPVLDNEGFGPLVHVETTYTTKPMTPGYGWTKTSLWDRDGLFGSGHHIYDAAGTHIGDVYAIGDPYGPQGWHAEYISAHDGDAYVANANCRTPRMAVYQIVGARRMSSYYCCEDTRYRRLCTCR